MKRNLLSIAIIVAFLITTAPATAWISSPVLQDRIVDEPTWLFETNQSPYIAMGDNRALVVSSGCDVNGDGYDDLLIGRKDLDSNDYRNVGRAWLFLGGEGGLEETPSVTFDPPQVNHLVLFATHVACAGDVNGDGYEDIMIGMPGYSSNSSLPSEGAVFVYYGSADGPNVTYDWMARGDAYLGLMGSCLDSAGDVNGDGYDDIIVGTIENDNYAVSHAYVWYGGEDGLGEDPGLPSNADWVATGPTPGVVDGHFFGLLVYGIGDVNGDTNDDIMVTAYLYDGIVENEGAAFVWYGSLSGLGEPGTLENADWIATSGQKDSYFGAGGDGVGDLNGDGYDDLAISAWYYDGLQFDGGKVLVWYGSGSGLGDNGTPANADWSAEGYAGTRFGAWTRPAGDVNYDGYADILVTAPQFQVNTLANAGAWFIWTGSADGLGDDGTPTNADMTGYGDQAGGGLGCCEAGAADVNNNGLADIFIAAFTYDHPEVDEGVVFGYLNLFEISLPFVVKGN